MGARVLVVDDDPWILRMVTATLQKKDFVVDTAREGRQALERAQSNPPDIIISDVMMPVMDGWTFVQRLRGIPRLAAIPVIFLTALGKDEAKLRSLGMGPDDFLPKPFRFEELEKRVSAALANAGAPSSAPRVPSGQLGPTTQSGAHAMPGPPSGQQPVPGYPGGYPPGYPYGPGGYPAGQAPPGAPQPGPGPQPGQFGPPGYPPGFAPPYASGYPGAPNYMGGPAAPPVGPGGQPGAPGQFAPYPGAAEPSKTPVRGPGGAAPQGPPPGAPQGPPPGAPPPEPALSGPPSAAPDQRLPAVAPGMPGTRRTTALNGRLEQLGLSSLLVMMEMERKDGVLSLRDSDSAMVGRIFLRGGHVISAKLDELPDCGGKECVYKMLAWQAGTFSFSATRVDMEDTVNSSTTHLLMEGARLIDEAKRDGDSDDADGDFL